MDNSPTTGSVNTSVAEKQRLAKSSLAFNCKSVTFRKLFPEYVEKYSQQQVAEEEAATQQTTTSENQDFPQKDNAKVESEKSVGLKKESIQEVGLKERRRNKKEALPGWIVLLLVSIVGVVMALPLLQL
jgi:ubiquitin-conjugating enzyme E2 J2